MRQNHFVLLAMGVVMCGSSAFAANYGTAGCGIGALAFQDQPGKIQIVSATLNNLISPQTSAITSGTSNCYDDDGRETASLYITVNEVALRKDISRGSGETLTGLAQILGCSNVERLGTTLQKDYQKIFPSSNTPAEQVNRSIGSSIHNDQELNKACRLYS